MPLRVNAAKRAWTSCGCVASSMRSHISSATDRSGLPMTGLGSMASGGPRAGHDVVVVQITVHQLVAWIGGEVARQTTGEVDPTPRYWFAERALSTTQDAGLLRHDVS